MLPGAPECSPLTVSVMSLLAAARRPLPACCLAPPRACLQIQPGQFVLFNGASFLADLSHNGLQASRTQHTRHAYMHACMCLPPACLP